MCLSMSFQRILYLSKIWRRHVVSVLWITDLWEIICIELCSKLYSAMIEYILKISSKIVCLYILYVIDYERWWGFSKKLFTRIIRWFLVIIAHLLRIKARKQIWYTKQKWNVTQFYTKEKKRFFLHSVIYTSVVCGVWLKNNKRKWGGKRMKASSIWHCRINGSNDFRK